MPFCVERKLFIQDATYQLISTLDYGRVFVVDKKLELVFIDKDEEVYSLGQVNSEELAEGLKQISIEMAKRLKLQREQR